MRCFVRLSFSATSGTVKTLILINSSWLLLFWVLPFSVFFIYPLLFSDFCSRKARKVNLPSVWVCFYGIRTELGVPTLVNLPLKIFRCSTGHIHIIGNYSAVLFFHNTNTEF